MVELGYCIARCKNVQKCFCVEDDYMCGHLMCYSTSIKFRCCLKCGCNIYMYVMTDSLLEIEMNHSILNQYGFYCIRYDLNTCRRYYKSW